MLTLPGYKITGQIHAGANSLIYRARRNVDELPVILKILRGDYPTPERIASFKREYEIIHNLSNLENVGVAAGYALQQLQQRWVMVLEDSGGDSLVSLGLIGQLDLADFLNLAIATTAVLGRIHRHQIIHKDINPSNLILNPSTKQLKLIDFGISTVLSREQPIFRNPNVLEGTLAYISPEQTGRMNRVIDYRTDFYSLGVTFYELLAGRLPFVSADPIELVHSHIAKQPLSLSEVNPAVPSVLSDIILKLMAKNAEDRYQSVFGLKSDLEQCLQKLADFKDLSALSLELGQRDIPDHFQIPQKLYGREAEIESFYAYQQWGAIAKTEDLEARYPDAFAPVIELSETNALLKKAHADLQQRVDELATLNRIAQMMASAFDLQAMLKAICQELVHIFDASSTAIALLDPEGTQLTILADHVVKEDIPSLASTIIPISGDLIATAPFKTGKPNVITQAQTNPRTEHIHKLLRQRDIQCMMIIPLLSRGRAIGAIGVDTDQAERVFTSAEVKLAETIAGQMAGAIENAHLFEEEQRQRQVAESLQEVATILNRSLDQETVLTKILDNYGGSFNSIAPLSSYPKATVWFWFMASAWLL